MRVWLQPRGPLRLVSFVVMGAQIIPHLVHQLANDIVFFTASAGTSVEVVTEVSLTSTGCCNLFRDWATTARLQLKKL